MHTETYRSRRGEIETYFDRTAVEAWKKLTSDAKVGRIRATVRAGRDRMRATLLSYLPADLTGKRVLDAGCGTGALAIEAARRGAHVVAIDLSSTLVDLARERAPKNLGHGTIRFLSGDMLNSALGEFDHVIAMDSLIHYEPADAVRAIAGLGCRCSGSVAFTFAPRTPALAVMHAAGKLFPKSDRSPSIIPIGPTALTGLILATPALDGWRPGRTERIVSGFYTSQAMELIRP